MPVVPKRVSPTGTVKKASPYQANPDDSPLVKELRRKLGANAKADFRLDDEGRLMSVNLTDSDVRDLSPLKDVKLELLVLDNLTEISDLSALKGMPLKYFGAKMTIVKDLSPLTGMPLRWLYLENTQVNDIGPLKGMDLEELHLSDTNVLDLSPLAGMTIAKLNLKNTPVDSLQSLKGATIMDTLWLTGSKVKSLESLKGQPLISLDIAGTEVSDLSPIANMQTLQRLQIAETAITDLTPLANLKLARLIFTPAKITKGIEVVRNMKSLQALDIAFPKPRTMTPDQFWKAYDSGAFNNSEK